MSTYREIVYMCLDEVKLISDDSYFTEDHIIFLADKYRAFILKKNYTDIKKAIPESNYQTICLDLENVKGIDGDDCSSSYLRSKATVPEILPLGNPKVSSLDFMEGEYTYVSKERIKYTGYNRYLRNIIYCTIGPDNKLYLKSSNPQMYYMEKLMFSGIFEEASKAAQLECNADGETNNCDPLDKEFPLEEAFIPMIVELIVKELVGAAYRPKDETNDAKDDLADLVSFIRRNMKSNLQKQIE